MESTRILTITMTEKFKILAKYIKDMSSETADVETFLFVKEACINPVHASHLKGILK